MRPGSLLASSHSALLVPFIFLSPSSQWVAGKSGAIFLMGKQNSLAHKRIGRLVGLLWLPSLCSGPWRRHLCCSTQVTPYIPKEAVRVLHGHCSQATLAEWVPIALGRWDLRNRGTLGRGGGVLCVRVYWNGYLLPFSWLGRQLGEEARPAGSRERHQIQGELQRKQTNRALCGCRWRLRREARPVWGGGGRRWPDHDFVCWSSAGQATRQ